MAAKIKRREHTLWQAGRASKTVLAKHAKRISKGRGDPQEGRRPHLWADKVSSSIVGVRIAILEMPRGG